MGVNPCRWMFKNNILAGCLFVLGIALFAPVLAHSLKVVEPPERPFWLKRPKVYNRVKDEREVIVSVKAIADDGRLGHKQLLMSGVAHANSSQQALYSVLTDFVGLKKMSSVVKEVRYDKAKQSLYMHFEAFNYHARMVILVDFRSSKKGVRKDLVFRVIRGTFHGMSGVVRVDQLAANRSEMSLFSHYSYRKLPVPQFFVKFGLEVVLQKIAGRIRAHAEAKKSREQRVKSTMGAKSA